MAKPMVLMDPSIATRPDVLELVSRGKQRAVMVHLFAMVYVTAHDTDGFLFKRALKFVHGRRGDVKDLVEVGLWSEFDDGWGLLDWAENQMHRPRVPVPRVVRLQIFERDKFSCRLCGTHHRLSIDHIVPWVLGGTNNVENLQTLCISCNSTKKDNI